MHTGRPEVEGEHPGRRVRFTFEIDNCASRDSDLLIWLKHIRDEFIFELANGEVLAVSTVEVLEEEDKQ